MSAPIGRIGPIGPGGLLVACDLDRTLIYSRAAMALGEPVPDPVCVEVYDGRDTSFISPVALEGLARLSQSVGFCPTTTRTVEQYSRIRLPGVRVSHAITTNGAVIVVDGRPCPEWTRQVDEALGTVASYGEAAALLGPVLDRPWVTKNRSAEDRFVYAVFERSQAPQEWFGEIGAAAAALGWVVSVQGRKAYVIPAPLTKEAALAEVVARVGATRVAAAGDSLLDRGLLEAADLAVRPAHGELEDARWQRPGLVVTRRAGGGAAEEIVDRFCEVAVPVH